MVRMEPCLACELAHGDRPLPGGLIHGSDHWRVEHCVGPLGLATLIVKPIRHVTAVANLSDAEAAELGPLLKQTSAVVARLVEDADQVYNCLWSHAERRPGHIHYVVQPITAAQMSRFGAAGPALQLAMFDQNEQLDEREVERVAELARGLLCSP